MKFTVKTVFSREDVVAFQRVLNRHVQRGRFLMIRSTYTIMTVIFAIMTVYALMQNSISTAIFCAIVTLASVFLTVNYESQMAGSTWKRWKRQNGESEIVYVFDEDGIGSDGSDQRASYEGAHGCFESERYYFLFMTRQICYILRKNDFTEGKIELFAPFIARKTGMPVTQVSDGPQKR